MPTRIVTKLRRSVRGRNAVAHGFELWVGLAGIANGIVFIWRSASLSEDVLSHVIGRGATAVWVVAYFLASAAIWYGLLRPNLRLEVAGLWLLGSATAGEAVAIIDVFAWKGATTSLLLFALTAASWLRALSISADVKRIVAQIEEREQLPSSLES